MRLIRRNCGLIGGEEGNEGLLVGQIEVFKTQIDRLTQSLSFLSFILRPSQIARQIFGMLGLLKHHCLIFLHIQVLK